MSKVIYEGRSDFQEFSKADFQKADVDDQGKVRFAQGEPTEVSDAAAKALTSSEGIFAEDQFTLVEEEETDEKLPLGDPDEDEDDEDLPPYSSEGKEDEVSKKAVDTKVEAGDTAGSTSSETTGRTGKGTSTASTAGTRAKGARKGTSS